MSDVAARVKKIVIEHLGVDEDKVGSLSPTPASSNLRGPAS